MSRYPNDSPHGRWYTSYMHTVVVIIRSLFGTLFLLLTLLLLPVWMVGSTVSRTVVNPQHIKTWVAETGVYDSALGITVKVLTQLTAVEDGEEGEKDEGGFSLTGLISNAQDPSTEYGQFARKIFAPERLQRSVETVVDAFYAWFRGETALPEFEVRLLDSREDMTRLLTLAFKEKFNALPVCPLSSLASASYDFNPLEATCRPVFFTDAVVDQFMDQLANQPELATLLDSTTIKGSSMKLNPEYTPKIQLGYTGLRWLSWVLGGVIVLFAGLFLLVFPWSKRVPLLGALFVAFGGAGNVGSFIGRAQVPVLFELAMGRIPPEYSPIAASIVQSLVQQVVDTVSQTLLWHALIVAGVGVALIGTWVIVHVVGNKK